MDPVAVTAMLDETWRSIGELGTDLTEDEWLTPTDCPGWTVKDNVSHLIGIERMLEGLAPTGHRATELGHVRNEIGTWNEHEVDARRATPGADVLAEFAEITDRRRATFAAAGPEYFEQDAMTPVGPGTVLDFLSVRVLDCWVHEQDMRRALGRPGHQGGPAAEHTIDRLLRTLPIVVGKRAAAPDGSTTVIRLTGPVERTVSITVAGGRAKVVDAVPDQPLAQVAMDSETFLVLATGRQPGSALADRVRLDGDPAVGRAVVDNLNMMI